MRVRRAEGLFAAHKVALLGSEGGAEGVRRERALASGLDELGLAQIVHAGQIVLRMQLAHRAVRFTHLEAHTREQAHTRAGTHASVEVWRVSQLGPPIKLTSRDL